MFKVHARSIEEYFRFDARREPDLRQIDGLIRAGAPALSRWLVEGTALGKVGMSMTMIGYGRFEYTVKFAPDTVVWPIVGLALQKNHLSLYLAAKRSPELLPFAHYYESKLGHVNISSTGAIRFEDADSIDPEGLTTMISDVQRGLADGTAHVRYRTATTVSVKGFPLAAGTGH